MKRSTKVTLTVVAAMGLAGCTRHYDPCEASYFDAAACNDAVIGGRYWWHGSWYPMRYRYAYPYYYDSYQRHVASGGRVYGAPAGTYARPANPGPGKQFGTGGASRSSGSVTRGGFGSTGGSGGS